jgi:hypothetical protein
LLDNDGAKKVSGELRIIALRRRLHDFFSNAN